MTTERSGAPPRRPRSRRRGRPRRAGVLTLDRPIAMIGLMGAGKTSVGRRLARALNVPFVDSDEEIERAAGMKVAEIFDHHGEDAFRDVERSVIRRLTSENPKVIGTGGGAFMNAESRAILKARTTSIWLKADLPILMERVMRKNTRPLLQTDDPEAVMRRLMDERYPVYAEADITVESAVGPHSRVVSRAIAALRAYKKSRSETN